MLLGTAIALARKVGYLPTLPANWLVSGKRCYRGMPPGRYQAGLLHCALVATRALRAGRHRCIYMEYPVSEPVPNTLSPVCLPFSNDQVPVTPASVHLAGGNAPEKL